MGNNITVANRVLRSIFSMKCIILELSDKKYYQGITKLNNSNMTPAKYIFFMSRELLIFINVSHDNRERSEKFEDTKEVTRILKSKKDRQHKGKKK